MGRKLFRAHLADSSLLAIPNIENVVMPEDGIITCSYRCPPNQSEQVTIQLCATDLDEYPTGNSFMLFTDDEFLNPLIPKTLQKVADRALGMELAAVLSEVSRLLTTAITNTGTGDSAIEGPSDNDGFDFDFEGDSDNEHFGLDDLQRSSARLDGVENTPLPSDTPSRAEKIRADLKMLKEAGFRVGGIGNLPFSGVLSISIRLSKLGLSDEAMRAWNVHRKLYLVLLIRYARGYKYEVDLDLDSSVEMRVGLCEQYKPSAYQAQSAFQCPKHDLSLPKEEENALAETDRALQPLFIGKALSQFLGGRLFHIIRARQQYGLSWLGAEMLIEERQAFAASTPVTDTMDQYQCDDAGNTKNLPDIVRADHLQQVPRGKASLPLIIMQFVLRHFVRCTEFCLVCHCRVDGGIEALKPYVCSKPLCLYQYMTLGFGPSLEWEILSQPYVVDLLVSFCYTAATSLKLKEMPVGMNITVPIHPPVSTDASPQMSGQSGLPDVDGRSFGCKWYRGMQHLILDDETEKVEGLRCGGWLVLICRSTGVGAHCRVAKVELPKVFLGEQSYIYGRGTTGREDGDHLDARSFSFPADGYLYDKNFDDLPQPQQQQAVVTLLNALPPIKDMCANLKAQGKVAESSLRAWHDRISESSLNLLRWIVASNRSCIVLVGDVKDDKIPKSVLTAADDRVGGMDSWMQFRFAQGAPDKEKRFNDCVKAEAQVTKTQYPTFFAFHGSQLANWHSIVRQGLRFDDVVHGRAYGNGVYMSRNAQVSLGYSNYPTNPNTAAPSKWPQSVLQITQAFSLNEVVNHPGKFVSSHPHEVVSDLDWIQTRYLFVRSKTNPETTGFSGLLYEQDPSRVALNEQNQPVSIPITAISKSRRPGNAVQTAHTPRGKRFKTIYDTDQATVERQEDDADSMLSDVDDVTLINGVNKSEPLSQGWDSTVTRLQGTKGSADPAEDDFVPGQLDTSGITFMEEPQGAAAASGSTKALMRLLQDGLAVQDKTPPATLGWYIDRNLISNMYQWIVELHSFAPDLPLARDMKSAGVRSIVLEMRFTAQFPFSPPFIRVVKPRFLPFARGGGGNVTEGGAMCMEVLTNNGWSAGLTIENLLLQVRLVIADEERPARLAQRSPLTGPQSSQSSYGIGEAKTAYVRACQAHGWTVPDGFNSIG